MSFSRAGESPGWLLSGESGIELDAISIMVTLFADGQRDGQAVGRRGKGAGGERSVGARGIFETVEIENEFAGLFESVRREAGVKKAASTEVVVLLVVSRRM